jgi:hypothetical protein
MQEKARSIGDPDQCLEEARSFALRASARLDETIRTKREPAVLAAGGNNFDPVTCGGRGSQCVPEILLDPAAAQSHLTGE